jgi:hypothetical protein
MHLAPWHKITLENRHHDLPALTAKGVAPTACWIGRWMGYSVGLDTLEKRKMSYSADNRTRTSHSPSLY